MRNIIEVKKTAAGWTAKCDMLGVVRKAETKARALRSAKEAVNVFLNTTSAREVFALMLMQMDEQARIINWLGSEDAIDVIGRGFALRVEVAAQVWNGRSLASIAREYGVSRQTVWKLSKHLKRRSRCSR